MEMMDIRQEIISTVCDFNVSGISSGTTGNLSVRHEEGLLITPTGLEYNTLKQEDIVSCDLDGNILSGKLKPSSEWPFHAAIYKARADVNAVVHVHSAYATGLSCTRKAIPAFHYMIAIAGGDSIPCAEYATFGTVELSKNIIDALVERDACLMANHGMVAVGSSITNAYALAHGVESLAQRYCISLQAGEPVLLDTKEMKKILNKFADYGKQDPGK